MKETCSWCHGRGRQLNYHSKEAEQCPVCGGVGVEEKKKSIDDLIKEGGHVFADGHLISKELDSAFARVVCEASVTVGYRALARGNPVEHTPSSRPCAHLWPEELTASDCRRCDDKCDTPSNKER